MNINYNIIDDNLIQIYGEANGLAYRVEFEGRLKLGGEKYGR